MNRLVCSLTIQTSFVVAVPVVDAAASAAAAAAAGSGGAAVTVLNSCNKTYSLHTDVSSPAVMNECK